MNRKLKVLALLTALTLCVALSGANAQAGIEGTWMEQTATKTTVLVIGRLGNYLVWHSLTNSVDTGTYAVQGDTLALTGYESTASHWQYSLAADSLSVSNEGAGISYKFTRTALPPPARLIGRWEGKVDQDKGSYSITLMDSGEFEVEDLANNARSNGIFMADDKGMALCYANGMGVKFTYSMTSGEGIPQLSLYFASTGDLHSQLSKAEGQPGPVPAVTAPPALPAPAPVPAPQPPETPIPTAQTAPGPLPAATPAAQTPPAAALGLTGSWRGKDQTGERTITFTADGGASILYEDPVGAAPGKKGAFIASGDTILVNYGDGTIETFRYILMGDSLLLSDPNLQNPVTYSRMEMPVSGLDPAFVGTWGGNDDIGYIEVTFHEDGSFGMMRLYASDTILGKATIRQGVMSLESPGSQIAYTYEFPGDRFVLADRYEWVKKTGPLARERLPESVPSAASDPALAGVWGGTQEGVYTEHAFFADGRYERFCPADGTLNAAGNHMAAGGHLAILTMQGGSQGTYAVEGDTLTLTFAGGEPVQLLRKDGILRRLE